MLGLGKALPGHLTQIQLEVRMIQQKTAAFHKSGPALKPNLEIRHPGLQRPS